MEKINVIERIEKLGLEELKQLAKLLFGNGIIMVYNGASDYGYCFLCDEETHAYNEEEHYHDANKKGILGLVYFYIKDTKEISGTGLATAITSGLKAIEMEAEAVA